MFTVEEGDRLRARVLELARRDDRIVAGAAAELATQVEPQLRAAGAR